MREEGLRHIDRKGEGSEGGRERRETGEGERESKVEANVRWGQNTIHQISDKTDSHSLFSSSFFLLFFLFLRKGSGEI